MRVLRVYHAGRDAAHRQRERALADGGAEITLVVPRSWPEAGAEADLSPESFRVVELSVRRAGDVNRHRHESDIAVRRLLAEVRPHIVDLAEEPFSRVARQWLQAVDPEVPVVGYTAQNIDKRWPPPFAQWEVAALGRLAGVYPCSRQAASVLRGKGYGGRVEVLPLGVDTTVTRAGRQRHDDEVWTLLLVGRLVPEKGVRDAVQVLAAVRRHRPARLQIIGSGPEGDRAMADAVGLGLEAAVEVRPWASAAELAEAYRQAHVVLLPSRATRTWVEQFGRVILEGQLSGAVVVGWASGSIPEVGMRLVPLAAEGDVAGMARQVLRLSGDPVEYERLRLAGTARRDTVCWPAVAERQLGLYQDVVAGGARRTTVRPDRSAAQREFGPPARVAGGGRPFALPLLREDRVWTRQLARAVDSAAALTRAARQVRGATDA